MAGPASSRRHWLLGGALVATGAVAWAAASLWAARSTVDDEADRAWLRARLETAATPDAAARSDTADPSSYEELERHLKHQPRDGRALVFKARMDADAGRFDLAALGYAEATRVATRVARDPDIWVEYAEASAMAQGGSLIGEPERLLQQGLALNARHAQALDLAGSAAWEGQRYAQAAALWQRLLAQTPDSSERHAALVKAIGRAEMLAKVSLPPRQ